MRRATVASSTARSNSSGVSERTRRVSDGRAPNSLRNWPIGMITNSSCDCPNAARVGSLTPTTRKFTPWTLMRRSMGSSWSKSRSAVSAPSSATPRLRSTSVRLTRRPRSAVKVGNST